MFGLPEKRKRSQLKCEDPSLTDQSMKNACDINHIIDYYSKTGTLPHFKEKVPRYIDTTQLPNLMTAFDTVNHAKTLFAELPPKIRKLMDNNPANLEGFLLDRENHDMLIKAGVLSTPEKPEASAEPVKAPLEKDGSLNEEA